MPNKLKTIEESLNEIEMNEDFLYAFNSIETSSRNIFLTGRAGTGKSTLLAYFRSKTKKDIVVLAPTGVSALNIKGQTIHSFFGFKPNVSLSKIRKKKIDFYKKIDTIIIDEISMVRADLLDCVDKFLKLNGKEKSKPFGGIQMIFIGDLYQLPPVITDNERQIFDQQYKTPYFFSAKVFENFDFDFIELNKIYRQKDNLFINLLNIIRSNSLKIKHLEILNQRHGKESEIKKDDFYIHLTTTNKKAEEVNLTRLYELKEKEYVYGGVSKGNFEKTYLPTENDLRIKKGSQIMLLNNDTDGRWVNGSVGKIVKIIEIDSDEYQSHNPYTTEDEEKQKTDIIVVELDNGNIVEVQPYKWDIFNYEYNQSEESIESKIVGSFIQYPLKLAWAITIHKSQGKTFDKVLIDFGDRTFAHGQAYVALSRCTNLEGIVLKNRLTKNHILLDQRVIEFIKNLHQKNSELILPKEEKINLIKKYIEEKNKLEVVYIKSNGDKLKKEILPIEILEYEIEDKQIVGLKGMKLDKDQAIIFDIDRILKIKVI